MRQGARVGDALQLLNLALTEDQRQRRTTKGHGAPADTPDSSCYFRDGILGHSCLRHQLANRFAKINLLRLFGGFKCAAEGVSNYTSLRGKIKVGKVECQ